LRLRLTVTTPLSYPHTPLDPTIDFPEWIRQAEVAGVLDPNSIEVHNTATDQTVPHAISEDFAYGDKGRVEFVIADPSHTTLEIRWKTAAERPPLRPQRFAPQAGVGDLLRYNAGHPRPITVPYSPGLHDLNGDGQLDLTGTWNYAYRPGWPWDGVVCSIYLLRNVGTKTESRFASPETLRCFGEPIRVTNHGPHPWPGDFDGDGLPDLITCVEWSVYPYYSHAAMMMKQRPEYRLELLK
jgi:hypothetical protein